MTGWPSGFTTWVKEVSSEYDTTHCVIHREVLASWKMSLKLNILKDRIKLINHIKVPVHPALEEMGTEHTHLLHTEVRWLLKVDCWLDLLSYKGCSRDFFKKSSLAAHFSNTEWVTKLLVWHIQPAQQIQSVTSGENDNCVQVSR